MKKIKLLILGTALSISAFSSMLVTAQTNGSSLMSTSVDEGFEAYQKGDHKRAFEIWSYHAENYPYSGSESEKQLSALAQTNLGALYYWGHGTYQSYIMSAIWHKKSAYRDNAAGQNNLGEVYEKGLGVYKDLDKAVMFYEKSAAQGDPNGVKNFARLKAEMKGQVKRTPKFRWAATSAKEAATMSAAYSNHNKHPIVVFQLRAENFDEKIAKSKVWFIDLSTVKDVNIEGKIYKKANFLTQYFRTQKFAAFNDQPAETFTSGRSTYLFDCTAKLSYNWTYQYFELDEQTGKINNYDSMRPEFIKLSPQQEGTIGLAILEAACAGKYMHTPKQ